MLNEESTELTTVTTSSTQEVRELPLELIGHIAKYAETSLVWGLAQTNNRCLYYIYLQSELDKRAAKQLMEYVLYPTAENVSKAKAMYAANPRILFIKTEGIEPASGIQECADVATGQIRTWAVHRKIIGSPFQAALGTGDKELYNDMAAYFHKIAYKDEHGNVIETGVQRAQKQIQEKFPSGFDYPPSGATFHILMTAIVTAIANDQTLIATGRPNKATQKAVARLRRHLLPNDVTQGHHFNLNYLAKALRMSNQNSWHSHSRQVLFFWRQVIGYVERLVSVVDAQTFGRVSAHFLAQGQQPNTRSLSLYTLGSGISYYFPASSTATGLGFDFGIQICNRSPVGSPSHFPPNWRTVIRERGAVERLYRAKTSDLESFKQYVDQRAQGTTGEQLSTVHNALTMRF